MNSEPKTIQQRLEEAKANERRLWAELDQHDFIMIPMIERQRALAMEWCNAMEKTKLLAAVLGEMEGEQ